MSYVNNHGKLKAKTKLEIAYVFEIKSEVILKGTF